MNLDIILNSFNLNKCFPNTHTKKEMSRNRGNPLVKICEKKGLVLKQPVISMKFAGLRKESRLNQEDGSYHFTVGK